MDLSEQSIFQERETCFEQSIFQERETCLDPALAEALSFKGENRARAIKSLAKQPNTGSRGVHCVKMLSERAATAVGQEIGRLNQCCDNKRAGAGGGSGEGSSTADGGRERWAVSDGTCGREAAAWSNWFASAAITPIFDILYGDGELASHHAYMLRYTGGGGGGKSNAATALGFHIDDADVTVNINCGGIFQGGDLHFFEDDPALEGQPRPGTPDPHKESERRWSLSHSVGTAIFHDGNTYHAAGETTAGERCQLIWWAMRNDAAWKRGFYGELEASLAARPAAPP